MNRRLQLRVQRYGWDRAGDHYGRFWARQVEPAQERLLEMAALQPGERVLDVACGPGLVTFPAAEAVGPEGEVVGADISETMVETASREAEARTLGNTEFVRTDAESLDFPDGSFDAVLCSLGLMYAPEPRVAVEEMHRVLRPGGRAVAAVWGARANCGWAPIFPIMDARVETEVCPLFFQLGTGDTLADRFTDAGFEQIEADRLTTVLEYDTAEDAVGAAFVGGAVAMAYARFDEATREEAHREYLEAIEPHRDGDGYRLPGEFVVVAGRKG